MLCVICGHGETHEGTTTVTLERGTATLVVKHVPALVCGNCGEVYLSEAVSKRLLTIGSAAVAQQVQVSVQEYPVPETA